MTTHAQIEGVLKKRFPGCSIKKIFPPARGLFNENWIAEIKNPDRKIVVRIYPKDGWKAKKEEYIYGLIKGNTDVPVPEVYCSDSSCSIIPKPYLLMSFSEGKVHMKATELRKGTIREMGRCLAKIHSIKMGSYGWIIGNAIKPSFGRWKDFMDYDFKKKMSVAKKYGDLKKGEIAAIQQAYAKNSDVFEVEGIPCLLHKDYHLQNIFIKNGKVSGVIDFEWALGGHNELDISKSMLFMFEKDKKPGREFIKGYLSCGNISREFEKRDRIYRFVNVIGNLSLGFQMKNKKSITENKARLKKILEDMP
ncbi:aminoglycoside phosphotransferase family protein [Candidatus Woesearchaeota archaeon]|nr:aminoglycoside phosphotransferase family protein [Candidatus Woesearchaeota archaeon]